MKSFRKLNPFSLGTLINVIITTIGISGCTGIGTSHSLPPGETIISAGIVNSALSEDNIIISTSLNKLRLYQVSGTTLSQPFISYSTAKEVQYFAEYGNNNVVGIYHDNPSFLNFFVLDKNLNEVIAPKLSPIQNDLQLNNKIYSNRDHNLLLYSSKHLYKITIDLPTQNMLIDQQSPLLCSTPIDFAVSYSLNVPSIIFYNCQSTKVGVLNANDFSEIHSLSHSLADTTAKMASVGYNQKFFLTANSNKLFYFRFFKNFGINGELRLSNTLSDCGCTYVGFKNIDSTNFVFAEINKSSIKSTILVRLLSETNIIHFQTNNPSSVNQHGYSVEYLNNFPLYTSNNGYYFLTEKGSSSFLQLLPIMGQFECESKLQNGEFRCKFCEGPAKNQCQTCINEYVPKKQFASGKIEIDNTGIGECYFGCDNNQYNDDNDSCEQCSIKCTYCINSTKCLSCSSGHTLNNNLSDNSEKYCIKKCLPNEYNKEIFQCEKCLPYCINCNDSIKCIDYEYEPQDIYLDKLNIKVDKSDGVYILQLKNQNGKLYNLTNFNNIYREPFLNEVFDFSVERVISGNQFLNSDTDIDYKVKQISSEEGVYYLQINITNERVQGRFVLTISPKSHFIIQDPLLRVAVNKSQIILIEIEKNIDTTFSILEGTNGITDKTAKATGIISHVSRLISTVGIIFSLDPTGILIRFTFVIQIIYKLKFININFGSFFGKQIDNIGQDYSSSSAGYYDDILMNTDGNKGKFNQYKVPIRLQMRQLIISILYMVSWTLNIVLSKIYKKLKIKKKINKCFAWTLTIFFKLHFTLFCLMQGDFIMFGSRSLLHSTIDLKNLIHKIFSISLFTLLIYDFFRIIKSSAIMRPLNKKIMNDNQELIKFIDYKISKLKVVELEVEKNKFEEQIQDEIKNKINEEDNIDNYEWLFKEKKSINELELDLKQRLLEIELINLSENKNKIHPYSQLLLKNKPGLAILRKKRFMLEKERNLGELSISSLMNLKDKILNSNRFIFLTKMDPIRNYLTNGLNTNNKLIFESQISKITNLLILIRTTLFQIVLVSLCLNP